MYITLSELSFPFRSPIEHNNKLFEAFLPYLYYYLSGNSFEVVEPTKPLLNIKIMGEKDWTLRVCTKQSRFNTKSLKLPKPTIMTHKL